MSAAGSALMAIGEASGDTRALEAAQMAIASPLLDIDISGARGVLFNITGGMDMTLFEVNEAADVISQAAHPDANIIFGAVQDPNFDGHVKITVIATGFDNGTVRPQAQYMPSRAVPDYDRSKLYNVPAAGTSNTSNMNAPQRTPQSQGAYNLAGMMPSVNLSNHPTGPLPAEQSVQRSQSGKLAAQATPSLSPAGLETGLHRAFIPSPSEPRIDLDEGEDEYKWEDESDDSHQHLPAPEPEPQASPQRPGSQQRHVRRLDRGAASDIARGNRNSSSGDVIDIPAFLRKR
jgi:cell division protein FtsZ